MSNIHSVCVFCGASTPKKPIYEAAMRQLGDSLVANDMALVYGGGRVGLMGAVAEQVLEKGGRVIGVIPHQLERREVAHLGLTELVVVDSMHERKRIMYDRSDAFACLPGGFGTMDEVMEILTWKQLGIHDKPIVFVNVDGYYEHLRLMLERMTEDGLLKAEYVPLYHFVDDVDELFAYLQDYAPHKAGIMPWA
jgi:uncharacterized protein (TIGR00730 family)